MFDMVHFLESVGRKWRQVGNRFVFLLQGNREDCGSVEDSGLYRHALNATAPDLVHQATFLHLGCGATILPGWLNADLVATNSVPPETHARIKDIFLMDATQEFPFADNQMDYVYCEDFIEHFTQLEGLNLCAECYRVLHPGGVWRVSTPGFDKILSEMQPRSRKTVVSGHWRWGHKLLYTEDYLLFVLRQCGFSKVRICSFGKSSFEELKNIDTRVEQQELNLIIDAVK